MDRLNPAQMVLLNILVTFVVSIATTIISIALLADTPLSITQVVNNVTERERLVDVQVEEIRKELLASIPETTPMVAGVATIAQEFDAEAIKVQSEQLYQEGLIIPGARSRIVVQTKEVQDIGALFDEGGTYEVSIHEVLLLHARDFIGFGSLSPLLSLGQSVVAFDPTLQRAKKTYIAREPYQGAEEDTDYSTVFFGVGVCRPGDLLFTSVQSEFVGICASSGIVLSGVERNEVEQEQVQDVEPANTEQEESLE